MKAEQIKTLIVFAFLISYAELLMLNEKCNNLIDYITAEKEVLKTDINGPYQLAIDYNTNALFFSYTHEKSGKSTFESAYIDLKNNEFKIVNGIVGGFSNAVDRNNHIVYLGGENGIYIFDYGSNFAKHIEGTTHKIWQMFFKESLYYTKYPEEEVYKLNNGQQERIPQLINTRGMLVALDNNENIYFSNSSGLYIYEENNQKSNSHTTFLGDYTVNGFSSDVNGNLFFSTPSAIFSINDSNKSVKQLVLLDDIFGVAIEQDGCIIYATENSIIRLKPTKTC